MKYLPLFFDLRAQHCLVVGGGVVALRKATMLVKAGATISVVAPDISDALKDLVAKGEGQILPQNYSVNCLEGMSLVIAATDELSVNEQVAAEAKAKLLPVNVVDNPDLCSFILPSIIDRSPIMIAVSSGGGSPVLTRLLRSRIETMIPAAYGQLAHFASGLRQRVKEGIDSESGRRRFWERVIEGPIAEKVLSGSIEQAHSMFNKALNEREQQLQGDVALIGAGPGDPDLLTFKALRLLQSADVVLYDRLVSDAIVSLARKDAEFINVGKARSNHTVPQGEINQLLVDYAKQGLRVVRLKGGDPFIFGRGGEEIELLAENNVAFQIVPGITAAAGCAAYSGIPLTHRDYAQSVRFVTGHLKNNSCDLPWQDLVAPAQTVVFYMGLMGLQTICQQLIAHGRASSTPIALVQKGTTPEHKVLVSDLANMPTEVLLHSVKAPTLIIVGEVVGLHEKLQWFTTD